MPLRELLRGRPPRALRAVRRHRTLRQYLTWAPRTLTAIREDCFMLRLLAPSMSIPGRREQLRVQQQQQKHWPRRRDTASASAAGRSACRPRLGAGARASQPPQARSRSSRGAAVAVERRLSVLQHFTASHRRRGALWPQWPAGARAHRKPRSRLGLVAESLSPTTCHRRPPPTVPPCSPRRAGLLAVARALVAPLRPRGCRPSVWLR